MRRRDVLIALFAAGIGRAAYAQTPGRARIALVDAAERVANMAEGRQPYWSALLGEMRKLGYIEGQSAAFERWSALGEATGAAFAALARKIAASRPSCIVARGRTMTAAVAKATTTIPIITVGSISRDLRGSLARPGKNVTGVNWSFDEHELYAKQLEFLRELVGGDARIAWLGTIGLWNSAVGESVARIGARRAKVIVQPVLIESPVDEAAIRRAFVLITPAAFQAVYVSPSSDLFPHLETIARLAVQARLPALGLNRYFAEAGLTISYGPDFAELYRRAAHYVDRVLKGANPADLAIEQPDKVELIINLKTARALGIRIPQAMLVRADRVIE